MLESVGCKCSIISQNCREEIPTFSFITCKVHDYTSKRRASSPLNSTKPRRVFNDTRTFGCLHTAPTFLGTHLGPVLLVPLLVLLLPLRPLLPVLLLHLLPLLRSVLRGNNRRSDRLRGGCRRHRNGRRRVYHGGSCRHRPLGPRHVLEFGF